MQSQKLERRRMQWIVAMSAATALLAGAGVLRSEAPLLAQVKPVAKAAAGAGASAAAMAAAKRGQYLVDIGGCNDCHTPFKMGPKGPERDWARRLTGHPAELKMGPAPTPTPGWVMMGAGSMTAFSGPWGISYAANLTPDKETGLGNWTEEMFVAAMRTGKHAGVSRPILPPMPWESLNAMTDADIKAVFAYLRSLKPVKNAVPPPVLTPPPSSAARR